MKNTDANRLDCCAPGDFSNFFVAILAAPMDRIVSLPSEETNCPYANSLLITLAVYLPTKY